MTSGKTIGDEFAVGSLLACIDFSARKHKLQRRKGDNSAYINHPIGVALSLWNEGGVRDLDVLKGAILHDTVEDTDANFQEIEDSFGKHVRRIVEEVTDDKSLSKEKRKQMQVEHAQTISTEAKLVKLADKLYNLRDLLSCPPPNWDSKRIQGYFVWAYHVCAVMKGVNVGLDTALAVVFNSEFTYQKQRFRAIPKDVDLTKFLQDYYADMSKAAD